MRGRKATSVHIILDEDGIDRVRLYGRDWDDQERASALYREIAHLVEQIDRTLKDRGSRLTH